MLILRSSKGSPGGVNPWQEMRCWRGVLLGIVIATTIRPVEAAEIKVRIPGIYTNLNYNSEGGDLLGTEVFIVNADVNGYVAFVQSWQGGTTMPVVVAVKVDGDKLSFSIPAPSLGEGEYKGTISATGFDGTWRHRDARNGLSEEKIHLKRTKSYWH
jgi:hypothetical protein